MIAAGRPVDADAMIAAMSQYATEPAAE